MLVCDVSLSPDLQQAARKVGAAQRTKDAGFDNYDFYHDNGNSNNDNDNDDDDDNGNNDNDSGNDNTHINIGD